MRGAAFLGLTIIGWLGLGSSPPCIAASAGEILSRYESLAGESREKALLEGAKKEGRVVFWGVLTAPDFQSVSGAFKRRYPGIEVEYFRSGPERNVSKLLSEAKAGRYQADLFQNTSVGTLIVMQKGLTDRYLSPQAKYLKRGLFDPAGNWQALHHLVVVLAYNTRLVSKKDVPRSYENLLEEKWKGKMSLDTEDYDLLTGLEVAWGEEKALDYLKKLVKQEIRLVRGRTHQAQLLAAGEYALSIGLYLHRIAVLKSQGAPVEHVFLQPMISKPIPVTLMKRAPHSHAAALFLDWALSQEGQETITRHTGHFIARKDVADRFGKSLGDEFISIGPDVEGKGAEDRVKRFREILGSQ
jgi:iron(III) transport system substrate-binding protein